MSDQTTAPNGRPLDHLAPPGHSRAAHGVHGYCSACPGIELWEELLAWRARENASHGSSLPDRAAPLEEGVARRD